MLAGVFQGAGGWRLDFIDGGVLVNCSVLAPNQQFYTIDFQDRPRRPHRYDTTPKPLVLTMRGNESIVGPAGPVTIDGVINTGMSSGRRSRPQRTQRLHPDKNGNLPYQFAGIIKLRDLPGRFAPLRPGKPPELPAQAALRLPNASPAPLSTLTSKGASTGIQTMQTDLLKSMFSDGRQRGAPPPPVHPHAGHLRCCPRPASASEFFPESVILGCGPDSARAYPYTAGRSRRR